MSNRRFPFSGSGERLKFYPNMKAIIAEKPSVGMDIARVVGATDKKDGYCTGNGYMVTWALGHLVSLAMPGAYGYTKTSAENLPMLPDPFRLVSRQVRTDKGMVTDIAAFKEEADKFVEALSQRPEIGEVYSSFATDYPQYWVDIDAAKCEQSGVSPADVLSTLSGYYTGQYVSDFNRFSKLYHVTMQAPAEYRVNAESLHHMYVRASDGGMSPLSRFVRLTKTNGPSDLTRFNLFNAISISGSPAQGYSSGQVLEAIGETAREVLPSNYTYEFGGISREESKTTNNATLIFLLCMVLVYLILCALYESVFIPFAVLLSVPCGLMGSFLFAWLFGLENNIYMQTGLIMIIGLLAKTAILLTEYAGKRRSEGMTLAQAAYSAAKVRLRPILMTVLSMVFGLVPLMMAHGVGANGSRSLATGVIGGMIVGTLALLFLVPSLFIVFQYIQERVKHN